MHQLSGKVRQSREQLHITRGKDTSEHVGDGQVQQVDERHDDVTLIRMWRRPVLDEQDDSHMITSRTIPSLV